MARLAGKAALVTGAGNGIGRATARLFAAEGASVALLDCEGEAVREVERELNPQGAMAWEVDVSNAAQFEEAIVAAARAFGRLDILVNNAATYVARSLADMSLEEWHRVLNVNLTACFIGSRVAAREMRRQRGGSIVNICSLQAILSEPNSGAYAASKGGIAQLTRNLAIELAPDNIVVNSISPGFVHTRMSIINGVDETTTPLFQNYYAGNGRIPLRRTGEPEEIAAAVLFLASRECTYVTGADLVVDGGLKITL